MDIERLPAEAAPAEPQKSALAVRRWLEFADGEDTGTDAGAEDFIFDAPGVEAIAALCAGVILADSDEARANTLLAAGADCVYIGAAALKDSTVIGRLVAAHGGGRVGIYAPLQRQAISRSFETVSNADFKTVTPSICEPAWEVLLADGVATGSHAFWWLQAMRELGATRFLARVDIRDDTDLNLCAGLVEAFGDSLWIGPRQDATPPLDDWVNHGQCCRIALPAAMYARCVRTAVAA